MVKVRTTMRPDVEIDVTPQDYTDLYRQGLLVDTGRPQRSSTPAPVPATVKEN